MSNKKVQKEQARANALRENLKKRKAFVKGQTSKTESTDKDEQSEKSDK